MPTVTARFLARIRVIQAPLGPALAVGILLTLLLTPASVADDGGDKERFFETRVRPLLAERCFRCHGPRQQKGNLRLDSREALLKGGESGAAIVPGKPADSLVISAVRHEGLEMPPDRKLSETEIETFETWVALGVPWPTRNTGTPTGSRAITDDDRRYWAFRPVTSVPPPVVEDPGWSTSPVDRFVRQKLIENNLRPAPRASRQQLARRLYFDLLGVPPTPEELDAFVRDESPRAYERLVDRLLADSRYGEHWARYWLDLVRYAESDGYKQDAYRPNAWHYRDYVIRSLNSDKPYDRFVIEQLAGDELAPDDPETLAATAYLRHWIYEYNQRDVRTQWQTILNDITDVTADAFLGMGLGCARCHDHKYDPILQRDYYRFQAFFAALLPRDDIPFATPDELREFRVRQAEWESKTADIRRRVAEIEAPILDQAARPAIEKFPPDIRPLMRKARAERDPLEQQLADLAYRQVIETQNLEMKTALKGELQKRWTSLKEELAAFDACKPAVIPMALTVRDVGSQAPAVMIPGDPGSGEIEPGFLSVIDPAPAVVSPIERMPSTGRRSALARWIASPTNPLTTRVLVNRVWQHHFGRGIVATANDFGRLGAPPTHPELLDWLATYLVDHGWSLKELHRVILNSETYRQASHRTDEADVARIDPDNRWLWRATPRRLSAESLRDAMLAASGELDGNAGGASQEWTAPRRSVYLKVIRNQHDPLLRAFGAPDGFSSTSERDRTTIPIQALLMINGDWTLQRARMFAERLEATRPGDPLGQVDRAYVLAFARHPDEHELGAALAFLQPGRGPMDEQLQRFVDFCHVLLNANEFLYVD